MQRVTRFGVSVPTSLIKKFDEIIEIEKYKNRSKAISELIRTKVSESEFFKGSHYLIGSITYLYNPETRSTTKKIEEIMLNSKAKIISNNISPTKGKKIIGVITCSGDWFDIKDTYRCINTTKGVEYCNTSFVNPEIVE